MSSSNCCFLTCIQISQEAGQVVWYSHLFWNFPQFIVIHTVKGFGIVNKAEIFKYSLSFSSLLFILSVSFAVQKLFSLSFDYFCFNAVVFGVRSKNISLRVISRSLPYIYIFFPPRGLMVSGLTFKSLMNFELIFVYGVR